jgi:dTDP-4-amino-4,6-dideoxygalactose transaminase
LKKYRRKFFAGPSSGTAAIHLGLILLGVKAGDEVLSKHDFAASANPILYLELSCIY